MFALRRDRALHRLSCFFLVAFGLGAGLARSQTLVPAGAVWTYLDTGVDAGTAWRSPAFDDSAWRSGPAQLGYGDGDEATIVRFGSSSSKYITTYFRRTFSVADPSAIAGLRLRILRDDGAVVYLNGSEVFRTNMPSGTITATTLAAAPVADSDESAWIPASLDASLLVPGLNVIAVEIHQIERTSSDISFDLALSAGSAPGEASLTRGPYVQLGTPNSIVVRWRTDMQTPALVEYGPAPDTLLWNVGDTTSTTEHAVVLPDLQPGSTYYYAVGTGARRLAGGDIRHTFVTPPPTGPAKPTRIWVIGDSGTADAAAASVKTAYQAWTTGVATDFWLTVGDNAYYDGTDAELQAAVFDMYPDLLRTSVIWPALGNHDLISSSSATQTGPYFEAFSLPRSGEAGGLPSGTEAYYSFDYGNIHVVVLDSGGTDRRPGRPMATWLENDLAQNTLPWVIATFHHAPYSRGSHDSDTDTEMTEMREYILPILERGGADLVLGGHSHAYERSYLLDGHYGTSDTFSSAMKKDPGNGREDGTGMYVKPVGVPHQGTVYVVVGCSGGPDGSGSRDHPATFFADVTLGSLVIDVNGLRLDATFIDNQGGRRDYFTISKDMQPPAAPGGLAGTAVSAATALLQWVDRSSNESGFEIERSIDGSNYARVGSTPASATSHQDTGLQPATTYWYRVRAVNAAGWSDWSNTATIATPDLPPAPEPPDAPSGLSATARSATSVDLAWTDNAVDETGYEVQRATGGNPFEPAARLPASASAFTDTGLSASTTYTYRVRAFSDVGTSNWSSVAEATTEPAGEPGLFVPAGSVWRYLDAGIEPGPSWTTQDFDDSTWKSGQAQLGYGDGDERTAVDFGTDPEQKYVTTYFRKTFVVADPNRWSLLTLRLLRDDGAIVYLNGTEILRSNMPEGIATFTTPAVTALGEPEEGQWLVTALPAGGLVQPVNVLAVEVHQANGNSSDLSFDLDLSASDEPAPPPAPAAPTGLSAVALSSATIDLTWADNASGETGYELERARGTGAFTHVALLGPSAVHFSDTGLAAATKYSYRVRALSGSSASGWSNVAAVRTASAPAAPSSVTAVAESRTTVRLEWVDNSDDETGFQVQRSTNGTKFSTVAKVTADVKSLSISGLKANTRYYFRVRAFRDGRNSPFSQTVAVTTLK